jgi:uncharacterized membrane protein
MTILVLGLVIFLGAHSVRIVADGWRSRQIERYGAARWKAVFTLVSLVGLVLIVWGYGLTRTAPQDLWHPPVWTRHLASLLNLFAFVLIAAAYVPGTLIKAAVHHPMVLGVKVWAFAHLLSNGRVADVVLFGAFLLWAVADYASSRRRDRVAGTAYPPGKPSRDAIAIAVGATAWYVFALWLHAWLIGVQPFG